MIEIQHPSDVEETPATTTDINNIIKDTMDDCDVSQYLIVYTMSTSSYRPTKSVKAIKAHNKEFYKLKDDRRTTGTLYLLEERFTKDLAQLVRKTRDFFTDNTHKLGEIEVIPSRNYFRVYEFLQQDIPKFFDKAKWFKENWVEGEKIRETSFESLGDLKDELRKEKIWSLTPEEVAPKNYFRFSKTLSASPGAVHQLKGVTEDLRKGIEYELIQQNRKIAEACTASTVEKLKGKIQDFRDKFDGFDPAHNRVGDDYCDKLAEFAELVPSLLINDDTSLVDIAEEAKLLTHWEVDVLRDNEVARKEAVSAADKILEKLSL